MLVTDTSWAESHPVRKAIAQPYQAWRCVGWTDEVVNFLVVSAHNVSDGIDLPDGWLIGGPDALMELAAQIEPASFSVYVLDLVAENGRARLRKVTGIWGEKERVGTMWRLWYSTDSGEMKPCSRADRHIPPPDDLVCALVLGEVAAALASH
nr:hypothetical protein HUO10_005281 [Paraburkholderia busanensis]